MQIYRLTDFMWMGYLSNNGSAMIQLATMFKVLKKAVSVLYKLYMTPQLDGQMELPYYRVIEGVGNINYINEEKPGLFRAVLKLELYVMTWRRRLRSL